VPFLKKILSFYNYIIIYCFIILLFNIFLLQIPLANIFGYEFSSLNAVLLTFLSGLYSISLLDHSKKNNDRKITSRWKYLTSFTLFLALPVSVSLTHSLYIPGSPVKDGILFYLVITFPSVLIGFSLSLICVNFIKKFHKLLFIFIFLIILFIPVAEFYFNPQIYFYNPIFGYFPGTIYDEGLRISFNLVLYRILNVFYFGTIAIVSYRYFSGKLKLPKLLILSVVVIIAALFIYISPLFGFSTTFERLNCELGGKAVTQHFIIHFPPQLDKDFVKAIIIYHEYYYTGLRDFFGYDYPQKINSYLFLNNEQKKELFGSENADVAKPWMNSSFITCTDYISTLKHELAHCFSSVIGEGPLKLAAGINPYLIEGLAVAADPVHDDNNVDYLASLAYNNKYNVNLNDFFDRFSFFNQASSLSYIYAGSFSKYLINKYGIEKFKKLYQEGNFNSVYGRSLNSVIFEYNSVLTDTTLVTRADEANYYFGRKSIFYKAFPRYVQERIAEGWDHFNHKDYWEAKKIFNDVIKITNDYSAIIGYAGCFQKIDSTNQAVQFLSGQLKQFKSSAYYYSLEMKLGDMLSLNHRTQEADSVYHLLAAQNPNQVYAYLVNLRIHLLGKDSLIVCYLEGNDFDKFNILKEYISGKYDYTAFPVLIDLSNRFEENYNLFMTIFDKNFDAVDFSESYALFKLSNYMLEHLDIERARKVAALALRAKTDKNFDLMLQANYEKINWFYLNYKSVLNNITIGYNY